MAKSKIIAILAILIFGSRLLAFSQKPTDLVLKTLSPVTFGKASWYSTEACKYNPDPKCPTASGESLYALEKQGERFAASYDYPLGTALQVTNRCNGRSVLVHVFDRGPNRRLGRVLDLSKKAFKEIAELKEGIINIKVEVL